MQPLQWPGRTLRGVLACLALALAITVAAWTTLWEPAGEVVELAGRWHAEVRLPDGTHHTRTVRLPGLLNHQGVPPDAQVRAWRTIEAGSGPALLVVERPLFDARVSWDGSQLHPRPATEPTAHPDARGIVLSVPAEEPGSLHRLELTLSGHYGHVGAVGRILLGPATRVHQAGLTHDHRMLALSLAFALIAIMVLLPVSRLRAQSSHLYFGLYAAQGSLEPILQTDLGFRLVGDTGWLLRASAMTLPWVSAFLVATADTFTSPHLRRPTAVMLAVAAVVTVTVPWVPDHQLFWWVMVGHLAMLPTVVVFGGFAWTACKRRQPGSVLLLLATLPMGLGVISEVTLLQGMREGTSLLTACLVAMAACIGAAIAHRDARVARRHGRLVESSQDALMTVDWTGAIRDANPAALQLGRGADASVPPSPPENLLAWVDPSDHGMVQGHLARSREGSHRAEFRSIGGRTFESLAVPIDRDLLLLTLRDTTVRRDLDQAVIEAARMEAVAQLLGGIAHDFNNMLGTLMANLSLMRLQVERPDLVERLDRMETTVDRASYLTRRLLLEAHGPEVPCEVAEAVRVATRMVEPTLPSDVRLQLELPLDLPLARGNGQDLEQVLVNLLLNARDALQGAGSIWVRAAAFELRGSRGVAISVEDDGIGIPDSQKRKVFAPFVTTKSTGTGLGLAAAKRALDEHDGRIWIEDRPGGGTRVVLALHRADDQTIAPPELPEGRTILLVEDEAVLLEDYERALRDAGFDVQAFDSAVAASQALTTMQPDLLVTDVLMPGMNGLQLVQHLRTLHPEVPVLLVSAFVPDRGMAALAAEGHVEVLSKPIRASRLVATASRLRHRAEREDTSITVPLPGGFERLTAASIFGAS
ncbi:MAG: response regulator [Myxococcales bacterium]|nr:response regulator [Myxococcales bacterium]